MLTALPSGGLAALQRQVAQLEIRQVQQEALTVSVVQEAQRVAPSYDAARVARGARDLVRAMERSSVTFSLQDLLALPAPSTQNNKSGRK